MKPLVPKIRTGDVLYGTRNLRRYLRACSVLNYLHHLSRTRDYFSPAKAPELYTPKKNDEFLVVVNRDQIFLVWGSNQNVILPFHNPAQVPGIPTRETNKAMSRSLFSHWFSRTQIRRPYVQDWELLPLYLWASLHKSAWANKGLMIPFPPIDGPPVGAVEEARHPFSGQRISDDMLTDRATLKHAVEEAVLQGKIRRAPMIFPSGARVGPVRNSLRAIQENIRALADNPRLRGKVKRDANSEPLEEYLESLAKGAVEDNGALPF